MPHTPSPVELKLATPLPVVIASGPDSVAVWTLLVSILVLAVTVAALVVGIVALRVGRDSLSWARKDFEISSAQAAKADAERAKRPSLRVEVEGLLNGRLLVGHSVSPHDYVFGAVLHNDGTRLASNIVVFFQLVGGPTFQRTANNSVLVVNGDDTHRTLKLLDEGPAPDVPVSLGRFAFTAKWGKFSMRWVVKSLEGSWPAEPDAPVEQWGKVDIEVVSPPFPKV